MRLYTQRHHMHILYILWGPSLTLFSHPLTITATFIILTELLPDPEKQSALSNTSLRILVPTKMYSVTKISSLWWLKPYSCPHHVACTSTHIHTHIGSVSLWTHELPVNPAAAQYRPHCLSVVGVRGWRWSVCMCTGVRVSVCVCVCVYIQRDTGSRAWNNVRTPLFRPTKYWMPLIFTRFNITTKPLRSVCVHHQQKVKRLSSLALIWSTGTQTSLLNSWGNLVNSEPSVRESRETAVTPLFLSLSHTHTHTHT